jgi:hypothetical protein
MNGSDSAFPTLNSTYARGARLSHACAITYAHVDSVNTCSRFRRWNRGAGPMRRRYRFYGTPRRVMTLVRLPHSFGDREEIT